MGEWLKSHIGTVHTFQGKEAKGVILCLGLDETTKGAANWASQKPNLLNIAITRAKHRANSHFYSGQTHLKLILQ
jgi:superfamily I DNA and/or RNA helicase